MQRIVLSRFQVRGLLAAREAGGGAARVSPDLGLTTVEVGVEPTGVRFPDGPILTWEQLEEICSSERGCFVIEDGGPRKIQFFAAAANQLYSLMPTEGAPTMLVSGIPMHRFKDVDPQRDTQLKIETIAPVVGRVLDTATGLGYTAVEAARTADQVVTVEIEPAALQVARLNPWSRELFEDPKINQIVGDVSEVIEGLGDESFARIIHDPPMLALAGDLYSAAFYGQLFRVLQRGGRLFHYVGDPASKSGRTVTKGVVRRLQEAGFSRVVRRPSAFGLVAYK